MLISDFKRLILIDALDFFPEFVKPKLVSSFKFASLGFKMVSSYSGVFFFFIGKFHESKIACFLPKFTVSRISIWHKASVS